MIISGFPGIGKSCLSKIDSNVLDHESSTYPRHDGWVSKYVDDAMFLDNDSAIIVMSSHEDVRKELIRKNACHVVVYPSAELKSEYVLRYKNRGSDDSFIELISSNFIAWVNNIETSDCRKLKLRKRDYLSSVIDDVKHEYHRVYVHEYIAGLKEMSDRHAIERNALSVRFALSNSRVKEGDIVKDSNGSILVESIRVQISCLGRRPTCIYHGPALTKKGMLFKRKTRDIYQADLKW